MKDVWLSRGCLKRVCNTVAFGNNKDKWGDGEPWLPNLTTPPSLWEASSPWVTRLNSSCSSYTFCRQTDRLTECCASSWAAFVGLCVFVCMIWASSQPTVGLHVSCGPTAEANIHMAGPKRTHKQDRLPEMEAFILRRLFPLRDASFSQRYFCS